MNRAELAVFQRRELDHYIIIREGTKVGDQFSLPPRQPNNPIPIDIRTEPAVDTLTLAVQGLVTESNNFVEPTEGSTSPARPLGKVQRLYNNNSYLTAPDDKAAREWPGAGALLISTSAQSDNLEDVQSRPQSETSRDRAVLDLEGIPHVPRDAR